MMTAPHGPMRKQLPFYVPDEEYEEYSAFFANTPNIPRSCWLRAWMRLGMELTKRQGGYDPQTLRPLGL